MLWTVIWNYTISFGIDKVIADSKESAIQRVIEKHGKRFGENAKIIALQGDFVFESAKNYIVKE